MSTPARTLASRRGFSLLELSVSLVISAALVILTMRQMSEDLHQRHLENESKWVVGVIDNIQREFGISRDFSSLSDLTMGRFSAVPPAYLDTRTAGVTTVTNGFSGRVHVGPLSLGATNNAYALTYTGISRDVCPRLAVLFHGQAKAGVPLYAMVGTMGTATGIPTVALVGDDVTAPGHHVLQASERAGLDMQLVGTFCDSAGRSGDALRSMTLIRRPF